MRREHMFVASQRSAAGLFQKRCDGAREFPRSYPMVFPLSRPCFVERLSVWHGGGARSRGCLDFAFHKPANITHGDGEIVLSLQVDPELWSVAEVTAEA